MARSASNASSIVGRAPRGALYGVKGPPVDRHASPNERMPVSSWEVRVATIS